MRQIKRIFVHCTAGPQTQTISEIQRYWKNVNKWNSPGYHYIIKPDGEVVQLLDESKPSNGVAGYNSTSINVCYIGGVDKQGKSLDNRTEAQKASLGRVLRDLHSRYPDAEIMGHRDIWGADATKWKKMCPSFDVKAELPKLLTPPVQPLISGFLEPIKAPETPIIKDVQVPIIKEPKKGVFGSILNYVLKWFGYGRN